MNNNERIPDFSGDDFANDKEIQKTRKPGILRSVMVYSIKNQDESIKAIRLALLQHQG